MADLVPRENVSPEVGKFYPDAEGSETVDYRLLPEFGRWLVEIYPRKCDLGLLNKAVPYVLIKKFALSCWSELCEIFGIPPRVMKTNTTDDEMLERAETMMREIGSAAYFIIDTTEDFEFAQGVATNGDVYKISFRPATSSSRCSTWRPCSVRTPRTATVRRRRVAPSSWRPS